MGSIWYWLLLALTAVPILLVIWSTRDSASNNENTNDNHPSDDNKEQ
jgi:hypothetical protein